MDIAYDHIQEESLPAHHERDAETSNTTDSQQPPQTLNTEFQQAFQAVSASPWGARLGGWFGEARKQGQTFYSELQKEASEAQQQATKGLEDLRGQLAQRTAGLNLNAEGAPLSDVPGEEAVPAGKGSQTRKIEEDPARPESLTADIVKEAGSLVASLRLTATSKLKDLQRAEDAADEALLKFGTNVRDFLKDAVVISAPTAADASKPKGVDAAGNEVLFETTEQGTGKKVFHTTRLDAQLHAVHTTASSFTQDPQGEQWADWEKAFDIDRQTEDIAQDLDKFEDLRRAMEKLVPEKVEYRPFWVRYYFIRKAIDEEEKKRKEVLKGTIRSCIDLKSRHFTNTPQTPQQTTKRMSLGTTMTKRKEMQRLPLHSKALLRRLLPALPLSHNPQLAIRSRSSRRDEAQKMSRRVWQTPTPATILCPVLQAARRAVPRKRRRMPRRRTVMTIGSRE
jgi:hypothetical protein